MITDTGVFLRAFFFGSRDRRMDSASDGAAAPAVPLPMPVPAPAPVPASSPTTQSDGGGAKKSKATKGKKRISQDKRVKAKVVHILSATQE